MAVSNLALDYYRVWEELEGVIIKLSMELHCAKEATIYVHVVTSRGAEHRQEYSLMFQK
jgi:hypothetical protein